MMQEITQYALGVINKRAPVWAASMAGRTKVFTGSTPSGTAHVEGYGGRFKIVVEPELAASPDLEFVLLHEMAHVYRQDLVSMNRNQELAQEINVAADCIINDALIKMGVPSPAFREQICWGKKVYGFDCSGKSINELIQHKQKPNQKGKATAPAAVSPNGNPIPGKEEGEGKEREERGVGGEDYSGEHGLGFNPVVHETMRPMAHSIAAYARSMFFEAGFKSNNMVTRLDWRRNRSAFATRNDVAIPKSRLVVGGTERGGPLINLVLDTSGSMNQTWVATASAIATEIEKAGLDFDLWLTPSRRKAKNKKAVLQALQNRASANDYLEETSFKGHSHWQGGYEVAHEGGPTGGFKSPHACLSGADELRALRMFETKDPVLWIYIGDYHSTMELDLHFRKNFLHVMMVDEEPSNSQHESWHDGPVVNRKKLEELQLPRWIYKV